MSRREEVAEGPEIPPVVKVKVNSLEDLARFAAALVGPGYIGHSVYIIHFRNGTKHIYGILTIYRDYFKYYGVPMFYYYETETPINGKYVLVKVDEHEVVTYGDGSKPGWIHIPIITLSEKPKFIEL